MRNFRVIGSTIEHQLSEKGLTREDLAKGLGCKAEEIDCILRGRKICSFPQILKIADILRIDPEVIVNGDERYYSKNVVHCMTDFSSEDNREQILDDIYSYLDLQDMVKADRCGA